MSPDLPDLTPPGTRPQGDNVGKQRGPHLVWGMLVLVLLLALFVVLVLPGLSQQQAVLQPADPAPASASVAGPDREVASVARHNAEQALQAYLRLQAEPDLADAGRWAPQQSQQALAQAEQGDAAIGRRRYEEAEAAYRSAADTLQQLLDTRLQRFQAVVQRAFGALDENRPEQALADFELALLMEPADEKALAGRARARVRTDVLTAMEAAESAQQEQRLDDALRAYSAAVDLDPEYQPAVSALRALESRLREDRYQQALGSALSALDDDRFQASARALKEAAAIHPDSEAVQDLRLRLQRARQAASLESLRQQARRAAGEENWQAAEKFYRQALAIDAGTAFAVAGLGKARQRISLHSQLDHYLDDPERLYSAEPRGNAARLLASMSNLPANEPLLKGKVGALAQQVEQASTPVDLLLRSDGLTSVSIYHVGQFGQFSEKRLELLPGRYTVVGSRSGYRDVRRTINVLPGKTLPPLTIRCEQKI